MLKISGRKAIAGYAPCIKCGDISVIHFFAGGKKSKIPYQSCHTCGKTHQEKEVKQHIIDNYSSTLLDYSQKHGVDVTAEVEQIAANKWTENPAEYDVKVNGVIDDEPPQQIENKAKPSFEFDGVEIVTESVTPESKVKTVTESVTVNEEGEVIEEKPEDKKTGSSSMGVVLGAVALILVLGGIVYLVTKKRAVVAENGEKGTNND